MRLIGKVNEETPNVVVFAIQSDDGAFIKDGEEDDGVVDEAIKRALSAFEELGARAEAFAQRRVFHREGEGRLVIDLDAEELNASDDA